MCYSNCPYENSHGECRGPYNMSTAKPHCYGNKEWEDYKESIEDSKIERADYESTRTEGDNY